MARLDHRTASWVAIGVLALAGCSGDEVPIDTDASSSGSTGTVSTTDVDPDDGSDDLSTDGPPACQPSCSADQCCDEGMCTEAPEPACELGCTPGQQCLCPPDSDPCDCDAQCVSCGTDAGGYDPCIDMECPAGSICLADDPKDPMVAVCALQGCGTDPCACPQPGSGTAVNRCDDVRDDDDSGTCVLDCSAGLCPDGMFCRDIEGQRLCTWPGEGVQPNCCGTHGSVGCDIGSCQVAVCAIDPFCCNSAWDQLCADTTVNACPGLCPSERPWGDCINGLPCPPDLRCIGDDILGWCAAVDCVDASDCAPAPPTGTAMPSCEPILDRGQTACVLDCSMGETCPEGMLCTPDGTCAWQGPVPGFANCGLGPCALGEVCLDDGVGMMMDPTWSVCSQPGCTDVTDCTYLLPATGDAPLACGDPTGLGEPDTCYLDCAGGQTCPDGMDCIGGQHCAWPQGTLRFSDDFESGDFVLGGWTLVDVDQQIPNMNVDFVNEAWVVSNFADGMGVNQAATSTSWYEPAGQADDWLISPELTIGANTRVYWRSRTFDPMFPDGYELRISTATADPADLLIDPALFSVAAETPDYATHFIDLAPAGYADQPIYLAWRNVATGGYLLLVDDVFVVDLP